MRAQHERKYASFVFPLSIISHTPQKSRATSFGRCEHHFWAFFRGPRHKFCAASFPKGYHFCKGLCGHRKQVLVACYFLQPHFIDLAIYIRHFPKIATFWGVATFQRSERLAVLNFHTLKTRGSPRPQGSAHHFWALFRGPRHRFCATPRPKGYHVCKGLCAP